MIPSSDYRAPRRSDRYPYSIIEEDRPADPKPPKPAPLSAREMFAARTAEQNVALRQIKLTAPQRRALDAIAEHGDAPIHRGSVVTDAMFAKLEALGLVVADTTKQPHRAHLTGLGQAFMRRGPKGGKR